MAKFIHKLKFYRRKGGPVYRRKNVARTGRTSLTAALRLHRIRKRKRVRKMRRDLGVETKTKRYTLNTVVNNTVSSGGLYPVDANMINLMPNGTTLSISQGTGQGDRLGNKIKITNARLRFTLLPIAYDGVNNQPLPVIVRTMFMYDKKNPNTAPTPGANGDFFQNGDSSAGFAGDISDLIRPVNTDRYVVKHVKDYKIGWANYSGVTGADPAQAYYANNDFKMMVKKSVNYNKFIVHNLKYDDTDADQQWRGLWFFYYAVVVSPITTATYNKNAARLYINNDVFWTDC